MTITGTSGVLTHTATLTLTVTGPPPPDFVALALSPANETITVGSAGTVSVTATATDGYTGTVNVSAENLPAGVTMLPATAACSRLAFRGSLLWCLCECDSRATATVSFLGQVNSVNGSADLSLTIASPVSNGLDVPTWHYRHGAHRTECQRDNSDADEREFRDSSSNWHRADRWRDGCAAAVSLRADDRQADTQRAVSGDGE